MAEKLEKDICLMEKLSKMDDRDRKFVVVAALRLSWRNRSSSAQNFSERGSGTA